ncbi:MAG: ABC transporter transmembrane domain-containing protein, partial [Bacteroidota bacterium]
MFDTLNKLRVILTRREGRTFCVLLVVIVFMGLFELAGIASIMPFMKLVSQPDAIAESAWLMKAYTFFDFSSERQFLFALGLTVLSLLTLANMLTVVTLWLQHKFAWSSAHSIATRLLKKYLHQPYGFFLSQNTSQMAKQILSETNELANGFLLSLAVLIAKSFVAFVIFALLVLVDPYLAVMMFVIFGSIYAVMYTGLRKYLTRLGEIRFGANEQRFKSASEAFAGIKVVKMSGTEAFFANRFATASSLFCKVEPKREASFVIPVYFVQTLAFGAILVFILYLLSTGRGLQDVIPLLSLYALAGYRLLPALQQVYSSLAKIRYQKPIVDTICGVLHAYSSTFMFQSATPSYAYGYAPNLHSHKCRQR